MIKAIQIACNELFELKCRLAAQAGFRHIAVDFCPIRALQEQAWEEATEKIRRILEENGLQCVQSHLRCHDLLQSSEIMSEESEFLVRQSIIASGRVGAEWCAFHLRTSLNTGRYSSASFADNRPLLEDYLELAHKYNTGIALENLPVFVDVIPAIPFYSSNYDDLAVLTDHFSDPRMGICWDTGHANLMAFSQDEAIRFLGSRIRCTHIHNNFRQRDDHLPPDQGTIPWEKVMKAFSDIGYQGPLTLETHCCYPEPGLLESFAKHNFGCLEFLERLM